MCVCVYFTLQQLELNFFDILFIQRCNWFWSWYEAHVYITRPKRTQTRTESLVQVHILALFSHVPDIFLSYAIKSLPKQLTSTISALKTGLFKCSYKVGNNVTKFIVHIMTVQLSFSVRKYKYIKGKSSTEICWVCPIFT